MRHLILAAVLCSLPLSSPVRAEDGLRGGKFINPTIYVTTEMVVGEIENGQEAPDPAPKAPSGDFPEGNEEPDSAE